MELFLFGNGNISGIFLKIEASKNLVGPGHPRASARHWRTRIFLFYIWLTPSLSLYLCLSVSLSFCLPLSHALLVSFKNNPNSHRHLFIEILVKIHRMKTGQTTPNTREGQRKGK